MFAAILSAAMSSLDSALNSLSAATMRDFITRGRDLPQKTSLLLSKLSTVIWGLIITGFAFVVGDISDTVIEGINKIGSAFYGPILASFLVGVLSKRANSLGIISGVVAGVGFNLVLWFAAPSVFWMWWNLIGLVVTVAVTLVVSKVSPAPDPERISRCTISPKMFRDEIAWLPTYGALVGYFIVICGVLAAITWLR